jgi:hypothetical protein
MVALDIADDEIRQFKRRLWGPLLGLSLFLPVALIICGYFLFVFDIQLQDQKNKKK